MTLTGWKKYFKVTEKDFLVIGVIHLFLLWRGLDGAVVMATKSVLLPILLIWTWPVTTKQPWLRVAMLASWLGDVLLLKENDALFFMLGLGAFLVAQLSYGTAFLKSDSATPGLLRQKPLLALPVLVLAGAFFVYLYSYLGEMLLPVAIYVCAISFMVLSAINRRAFDSKGSNVLIVAVLSFMLSDTLLAINKFVLPIPHASVWIMLTYMMAQYGIAQSYWLEIRI